MLARYGLFHGTVPSVWPHQGLDFGKGFAWRARNACLARAVLDTRYGGSLGVSLRTASAKLDQGGLDGNRWSVGKSRFFSPRIIVELLKW